MRLALVVPDGPGVRNFVLGSFLPEAARSSEPCVLHSIPEDLIHQFKPASAQPIRFEPLVQFQDTPLSLTLRNTLAYAQMFWADTGAMRYNRRARVTGSWKTKAAIYTARAAGRMAASPAAMGLLARWHDSVLARSPQAAEYRRLFEEVRPSVVFCSNQRAAIAAPAIIAAQQLEIPTATFIFSWDNISSKGRIIASFDHYLVWSDHMGQELLRFYPHVTPQQIHVVGTPQFDAYADPRLEWSREEFVERVGGDPARPLICYSGGDATVYTAEYEYVRLLMRMIRDGRVRGRPQVLLRPSPADDGRQYESVRAEFPELIYAPPRWMNTRPGEWTRILPLRDDVQMLANLTKHADVNINLNSTMTLDFAIRDRPVVNLAFDLREPPPFGQPLWDFFYQFEHYHPVINLGAARFARTPEQLVDALNAYLADPSLDREGRRAFAALEVGVPIGNSAATLLQVLRAISASTSSDSAYHPSSARVAAV